MAKTKRFLAMLLAVLMLVSLMPVALADNAVPELQSGEAYIPANASPEEVNHILSQTLIANYDEVGDQEWEYAYTYSYQNGSLPISTATNTVFASVYGADIADQPIGYGKVGEHKVGFITVPDYGIITGTVNCPAMTPLAFDTQYTVRIAGTEKTAVFVNSKYTPVINIADEITMTVLFNGADMDTAAMAEAFLENYVTVEKPEDALLTVSFDTVNGKATVNYAGTEMYKASSKTVDVTYIDNRGEVVVAEPDESGVYSVGIKYNEDLSWNYDATRQAIIDAVLVDSGLTPADVNVQHKVVGIWSKLEGITSIDAIKEGKSDIKLTFAGNTELKGFEYEVKVNLQDGRIQTAIVLKDGASIVYNKDVSVMKNDIFKNAIDWNATVLPEGVTVDDLKFEYKDKLIWKPVEGRGIGFDPLGAGEDQQIRISYAETNEYKKTSTEGTITVEKAPVKVSVKSTTIYPDQTPPADFVTTNPEDDFQIWNIYAGITSNVTTIVYVQLPDEMTNEKVMGAIDTAYKAIYGESFSEKLQNGMTVGELREILTNLASLADKATDNKIVAGALEFAGINVDSLNTILDVVQNLPGILDNVTVAIGTPNRAGLYMVTAVATNKNYKTGVGSGILMVKMRVLGVSFGWAQDIKTLTVSEAAAANFSAVVMYDGDPVKNPGNIKYLYTGISNGKLYSSHDVPTAPGKYIVTASVSGGNYLVLPITRTFTIVADPAPVVTPEV